jgi:sec-independent protein translocase protein TatA
MRLGTGEILLILAAVLLIFGPSRLPSLGDALGRGIRSFKRAANEMSAEREPVTRVLAASPAEAKERRSSAKE